MRAKAVCTYVLLLNLSLCIRKMQRTRGGEPIKYRNKTKKRHITSSSGVKSLTMLNSLRISSGVLPLIMLATVLQPTSLHGSQMSNDERKTVAC